MALLLTDEQTMLAETVQPFMADKAPVKHMRALRDDPLGFSRDLWRAFAELGLTGVLVGEEDGGLGLGHVEAGIVLDQIGRNLTPSPFLSTAVGAVTALNFGSTEQRRRWLPPIVAGDLTAAIALDEGARHRPARIATGVRKSGAGYVLNGEKKLAVHAHVADLLIVSARLGDGADGDIVLLAVPRETPGLVVESVRLLDSSMAARVRFEGATLQADALIGEANAGGEALSALLAALRVGAGAELAGVGTRAAEMTIDYLKTRTQFGKTIGSFQALQHRAAQVHAELELVCAAVFKAQHMLDAKNAGAGRAAQVAKASAGLAARLATEEGVQMHGGIGMTDEHDIGLYLKRACVLDEMYGGADFHADDLARAAGY